MTEKYNIICWGALDASSYKSRFAAMSQSPWKFRNRRDMNENGL